MFRPLVRAYLHFGRTPWWRILLGLLILGIALVVFIVYPTHQPLLRAATSDAEREAIKRVIRSSAVVEARRIGVRAANVVEIDRNPDGEDPPISPEPPEPPEPPEQPNASDPPRIVIAPGKISISAGGVSADIDAALADAERRVKEALKTAGVELQRATEEAKRVVEVARRPRTEVRTSESTVTSSGRRTTTETVTTQIAESSDGTPKARWHVSVWGIDFEGTGLDDLPTEVAREPLLTPIQQQAIERAIRFDVRKAIYGAVALALYTFLTLLLLVTRAFAGRSVRQTQRVKVVEAAAKVDSSARLVAEAQLKAMQAQVEPHFLFNTLAHVKALQEVDVKQSGEMLDNLIAYLRTALPNLREGSSTLGKEFELAYAYLKILKLRMGERLQFSLDLPESLKQQVFPPALIINLVENAIKHGVERARGGGSVRLNAQRVGDLISVTVADTGKGLDPSGTTGTGVGLTSIRDRLRLLYGNTAALALEPNSPSGVIATLTVPSVVPESSGVSASDGLAYAGQAGVSECKVNTALLLAIFGGIGGAHHWYLRRKKSAIAQLFLGFAFLMGALDGDPPVPLIIILGTWLVADMILIATKSMKDGAKLRVVREN